MSSRVRSLRILASLAVGALALVTMTACFGSPPPTVVDRYISAVSVPADVDAQVRVVGGQLREGTSGGPALTVSAGATVINGGSIQQLVTSDSPFKTLLVAVEGFIEESPAAIALASFAAPANAPQPESTGAPGFGFYEIVLSQPTTEATVVLSVPQALPGQTFVTYFAAINPAGQQGILASQAVEALAVGTGDVQVSVSWDVDSDLDLHVVDPFGEEIFWDRTASSSGGTLDLDSNAACSIDSVRNENVTWETGTAPPGEYAVLIDLWASCEATPTNFVVTVVVVGGITSTYTGSIDGPGDEGHAGSGQLVATFEVADESPRG